MGLFVCMCGCAHVSFFLFMCVFVPFFVALLMSLLLCCRVSLWTLHGTTCRQAVAFCWRKIKDISLMLYIHHSNSILTRAKKSHINNSFCLSLSCLLPFILFSCESHFLSYSISSPLFISFPLYPPLPTSLFHHIFLKEFFPKFFSISSIAHMLCHVHCYEEGRIQQLEVVRKNDTHLVQGAPLHRDMSQSFTLSLYKWLTHTVCTLWLLWALMCALKNELERD